MSTGALLALLGAQERAFGSGHLLGLVSRRPKMAVSVEGHFDRGMPAAVLHRLGVEPEPASLLPGNAPGSKEVPQVVHAAVFGRHHRVLVLVQDRLAGL